MRCSRVSGEDVARTISVPSPRHGAMAGWMSCTASTNRTKAAQSLTAVGGTTIRNRSFSTKATI